ncbi:MAG: HD domain-containing protein [Planctomycetota bacterium]
MTKAADEVVDLLERRGGSQYGSEAVTQREHALQCALLARQRNLGAHLVSACLLHDLGHLLHDLPDDAPERGIDDVHEDRGAAWLKSRFKPEVVEPVRLHVAAKRYLCAVDPAYLGILSPPSVKSLELQGGPMSPSEVREFQSNPHHRAAVELRRLDDEAKVPGLPTPSAPDFLTELRAAMR